MENNFSVRPSDYKDIPVLSKLFHNTVLQINIQDYTLAQVQAWSNRGTKERWEELFQSELCFFVAEDDNNQVVGFVSVTPSGYIHSLFVHVDYQRCGIAHMLLKTVEEEAKRYGASYCWSEVSITARGFFEKEGYEMESEQTVLLNQESLINYIMRKRLF